MALIRNREAEQSAQDAIVLDLGDLRREADRLRRQAHEEAERIRADARAEAQRLTEGAEQRGYEAGYQKGHAEGLEAGRKEGHEAALKQAESSLNQLQQAWVDAAKQWDAERRDMLREARQSVLRLAIRMAEKIVRRVPAVEPGIVQDQVAAAIEHVARPCDVTVRIHPDDRDLVQHAIPQAADQLGQGEHVTLKEDNAIERGGCVIDYGKGRIDATLGTQLDRLVEALLPGEPGTDEDTQADEDTEVQEDTGAHEEAQADAPAAGHAADEDANKANHDAGADAPDPHDESMPEGDPAPVTADQRAERRPGRE